MRCCLWNDVVLQHCGLEGVAFIRHSWHLSGRTAPVELSTVTTWVVVVLALFLGGAGAAAGWRWELLLESWEVRVALGVCLLSAIWELRQSSWVRGLLRFGRTGAAYSCLFGEAESSLMASAAASRLARVLDGAEELSEEGEGGGAEAMAVTEAAPEGFCVDCKHQRAKMLCVECGDQYCKVCFQMLHRKGNRSKHTAQALAPTLAHAGSSSAHSFDDGDDAPLASFAPESGSDPGNWFAERAKYIPMRLTMVERKKLRLLEAALSVSCYTDRIDTLALKKAKRTHAQLQEMCSLLSAVAVATDYDKGRELVESRAYKEWEPYFQEVLEIGRRHKVMNPEKMRGEYGKLTYLLQDSASPEIEEILGIQCVKPLKTVFSHLDKAGASAVLYDRLITTATREIIADGTKSRHQLNMESKEKHRAIEALGSKYASRHIDAEEIKLCLYSMGDNHSFLTSNRDPVDKMILYLTQLFDPKRIEEGYDLSISGGAGGARLSHSHEKQFFYVLQSLTLWREIAHDMFRLWCLSEDDLLSKDSRYELRDTGQGLQRVQPAPRVSQAMRTILHTTQLKVGQWIGSSVVHLGDNNVPNALVFIDKYTQVSSILNPIVLVLQRLPELCKDHNVAEYVQNAFGGVAKLRRDILIDFFRSAFDGSGADNFFDAGSCIDGRLTSAWHWCQHIAEKPFYPIFKLAGFASFDGEFQK